MSQSTTDRGAARQNPRQNMSASVEERSTDEAQQHLSEHDPDIPPCDACGKEFSGNLYCVRCEAVFYCSKECQRKDWRNNGHKALCDGLKEECETIGREVVETISNSSLSRDERCGIELVKRLDCLGVYNAAVSAGLHNVVRQLFEEDKDQDQLLHLVSTLPAERVLSLFWLFRGDRVEGRSLKEIGRVDAKRIQKYLSSDPEAFNVWFDASLVAVFRAPLDDQTRCLRPAHHQNALTCIRLSAVFWELVFASKSASRSILLSNANERNDAAIARAKSIGKKLHKVLAKQLSVPERDPNNSIRDNLLDIAAMVSGRSKQFNVRVNMEKLLKLSGSLKKHYQSNIVPLAEATIKKGGLLTLEEMNEAIASHANRQRR